IQDDDDAPSLTSEAVSVTEGDADNVTASFELVLSASSARTVTVSYATLDGSATAGEDYQSASGDVTFAPGETLKTVEVTVLGDVVDESAETFTLELSGAQNATLVDTSVTATIVDNDGAPSISIGNVTVVEDAATVTFPVTLSNPGANPVTVDYTTVDGTATAGEDYEAVAATLTFAAGETAGSVTVTIVDDTLDEDTESFSVTLSNAGNADIAVGTATATINDNDSAVRIAVGDASVTEGDTGSVNLDFPVSLSAPSGRPVSVGYATVDGTATAGEDYTGVAGTVDFAPGETAATVTVVVVGDTLDEVDETVTLAVSSPVNADLGDA
ncbi:Calx-beta domain-containing protein, partial [Lentisalinibacter sediminis]|uniref:Calx-beta domain-containing protein n=1 Tax=Lentisalinibacter sediminis TaxID=2992237 RepID=UPI00386BA204